MSEVSVTAVLPQKLFYVTEDYSTYDISQTCAVPRPSVSQAGLQTVNTSRPAWPGKAAHLSNRYSSLDSNIG